MKKNFYTEERPSTDSLYINTLIKLAYDLIENKKSVIELKKLCNILECLYRKLIIVHKNLFRKNSEEPVKDLLEEFHKITGEISKYTEHRNNKVLREDIENIITITEKLFESFKKLKEKEQQLPVYSKSPLLNELIISAREITEEIYPEKALEEKIHFLISFTEATERQIYSLDCDTVTLIKEYPVIKNNFSLFKEGLQEACLYFQDRQKTHLKKGINMASEAVEELFSSLSLLYEASDIITKIICLKCGHKNSFHSSCCALCRTLLPERLPSEEKYEIKNFEYIITDNFNNLLEGARQIEEGEIGEQEFTEILNSMEERLARFRVKCALIKNKAIIISNMFLYIEEYLTNIENGIKQMKLYKEKPEYLDKGLTVIFESSKIFNEIQLIAVEAEREIAERKGKISHI
ncbi:MAG: hypothetical protein ABRQ38_22215 [Candidatus Eremiobacterota bacterium]